MKIILEYDGDTESDNAERAMKGVLAFCAFDDVFNKLRSMSKYEDKESITIGEARQILNDALEHYAIQDLVG